MTWVFSGTQAQVTFSRDWNPGKRTENSDFHNTMKTVSAICHLLIVIIFFVLVQILWFIFQNQVRQLANCENSNDVEPGSTIFSGRR